MNITLRQLKAFVAVARYKSFTKAADELHLTQSSLSGLIKEMEGQIDTKLFDRTTRQLNLSQAGERILPYALQVVHDMQMLYHEISDLQDFHQGKVRIAAPQQLAASILPKLVGHFKKAYPNIQVNLIDCTIKEVVDCVQRLEADIGLAPALTYHADLSATKLFSSPFGLVVAPQHPLLAKQALKNEPLTWADLDNDLITLQEPFADYIIAQLPLEIANKLFRHDYQVNFLSTALGVVKQGMGIAMAPSYTKAWINEQGFEMIDITNPTICYDFLLYKHRHRSPSPAMISLESFLLAYYKSGKSS